MQDIKHVPDDHTCLSFKRQEVARAAGVWCGGLTADVVREKYAALKTIGVPDQASVRRLLGL